MVGGVYTPLDDTLASRYQSVDWTQHTYCQSNICWGNLLAPGAMHEKTSHETTLILISGIPIKYKGITSGQCVNYVSKQHNTYVINFP